MNSNLLARIADPEVANPTQAYFQGAQQGNYLTKISNERQADAITGAAAQGDKAALAKLWGLDYQRANALDNRDYQRGRDVVSDKYRASAEGRAAASEGRASQEFDWNMAAKKADEVARVVYSADTPEKFEIAKGMLKARGVAGAEKFTFADRQGLIDSTMALKDQIAAKKPLEVSAGASLMRPDGTVIGTAPPNPGQNKPTEAAIRNGQLYSVAAPEANIINETFGSLADPTNQIIGKAGLPGNIVASAPFQRAKGAISTIIATYLYSVSGATANPGEVANQTDILTPKLGDKADVIKDKLRRINTMVESIKMGAGNAPTGSQPPAGPQAPKGGAPQPGAVDGGFRFKGGNPGDPNSWEPVR